MVTDHQHGGYNMDDNEIGVIISIVAVVQLFFQVVQCEGVVSTEHKIKFLLFFPFYFDS